MLRIGLLALGDPTFDVTGAQEMLTQARAALGRTGHQLVGGEGVLFDTAVTEGALTQLSRNKVDLLILLQMTSTDAAMTLRIAGRATAPLAIWAFPERSADGHLRLDSFNGLSLAAHALGRAGRHFRWAYAAPTPDAMPQVIDALLMGDPYDVAYPLGPKPTMADTVAAKAALERLNGAHIGVAGEEPPGFKSGSHHANVLNRMLNIGIERLEMTPLFDGASACETDAFGTLTLLMLRHLAGEPPVLVKVVDMDAASNRGVVCPCRLAPKLTADADAPPPAQRHADSGMPHLQDFTLKQGRVTVARISQAKNCPTMVLAGAEIIRSPGNVSRPAGVIRFDQRADDVMAAMIEMGLEHDIAIVHGEHRGALRALAAEIGLPVLELA